MTEKNRNGNRKGMSPNSRKNLELGRKPNIRTSKDYSITRIIKEMMDEPADVMGADGRTWRQQIAYKILCESCKGNPTLIKELLERLEGKVLQPIGGEGDNPIEIVIRYETDKNDGQGADRGSMAD